MLQRAISGGIFVLLLTACIVFGPISLILFFGFAAMVGMYEFFSMVKKEPANQPFVWVGIVTGLIIYSLIVGSEMEWLKPQALVAILPLVVVFYLFALYSKRGFPANRLAFTFFCWFYIAIPFALITGLGMVWGEYDYILIMGFFVMLWLNDTGAYLAGRTFGKTPLFPRHSPKKTWEGFAGGVLLCLGAGFGLAHFQDSYSLQDWLVIAVIVSVFSNLGDLTESMMKRQYGIKDSGKIMPGHGGILDRFDGVFLSVPLIFTYLVFQYGL